MKKLRIKVFLVIFTILTAFTAIVYFTTTTRTYIERKNTISDILTKMPRTNVIGEPQKKNNDSDFAPSPREPDQDSRRIYLDFTIYTIILDEEGNYQEVINHTSDDSIDEEDIKTIANKIIKKHESDTHIGNLYTNKYAYSFTNDNTLIIMDNTETNSFLVNQLLSNSLMFILCEIIIFIIIN